MEEKRYPIQSNIILERVLTRELLSDLIHIFRESDFCIAILTADDLCMCDGVERKRLRQQCVGC